MAEKQKTIQLIFNGVEADMHRQIKIHCAANEVSMQQYIISLIKRDLERLKKDR